ncbi:MAG: DUF6677 family protein [Phycisphaerales bacterium]|jgi:hypothetical protein
MDEPPLFRPLGLVAACVLPGLGHIVNGETKRGLCIGAGVLGLFFSGLLIGGIDTIDSREDRVWFFGQALVGPLSFVIDYAHQTHFKVIDPQTKQLRSAYPGEGRDPKNGYAVTPGMPPNIKSISKMNELGTLFSTVAGMLNFIVVLDAGFPSRRQTGKA